MMTQLQAAFYLILAVVGFAAISWGFYKLMVSVFTELNKRKVNRRR